MSNTKPTPLPLGTQYGKNTIVDVLEYDEKDDWQPYLYELDNGDDVWIPIDDYPSLLGLNKRNKNEGSTNKGRWTDNFKAARNRAIRRRLGGTDNKGNKK